MNLTHQPILSLLRSVAIEPAACRRTALAMAAAADSAGGTLAASMATLARLVGLSTTQVRHHVHALVAIGVIEVKANAHGGAPGAVPHYRFNLTRLQAMATHAGHSADLFDHGETIVVGHRFVSEGGAPMVAQLVGQPGQRFVQFYRDAPDGLRDYGRVALAHVLRPWRWRWQQEGSWDTVLYPVVELEDDYPEEIFPGEFEKLQQWAQAAALGRIESMTEA